MIAKAQRHRHIIKLVESGKIANQLDLAQQLARVGVDTTQTTLSRDLSELGVVKSSGGYCLLTSAHAPAHALAHALAHGVALATTVRRLLLEVSTGGTQVIVHTPPGQASALAVEIDRASLAGVLGTIAGDDCIFVACASVTDARLTARKLQSLSQQALAQQPRADRPLATASRRR